MVSGWGGLTFLAIAQGSVPSVPGNLFTIQNYTGNQTFSLAVDSQHLPPQYLYYTVVFPSAPTQLSIIEGSSVLLVTDFQTFQKGSVDQVPVAQAATYRLYLNGSGQFAVFLLPQSWQSTGDVQLDTLGAWTTIGILRPMWKSDARTFTLSLTTSEPLTVHIAEFQESLGLIAIDSIQSAATFSLTPSGLTLFYLVFLQNSGSGPISVHIVMELGTGSSTFALLVAVVVVAVVVVIAAWLYPKNRRAHDRSKGGGASRRSK